MEKIKYYHKEYGDITLVHEVISSSSALSEATFVTLVGKQRPLHSEHEVISTSNALRESTFVLLRGTTKSCPITPFYNQFTYYSLYD